MNAGRISPDDALTHVYIGYLKLAQADADSTQAERRSAEADLAVAAATLAAGGRNPVTGQRALEDVGELRLP